PPSSNHLIAHGENAGALTSTPNFAVRFSFRSHGSLSGSGSCGLMASLLLVVRLSLSRSTRPWFGGCGTLPRTPNNVPRSSAWLPNPDHSRGWVAGWRMPAAGVADLDFMLRVGQRAGVPGVPRAPGGCPFVIAGWPGWCRGAWGRAVIWV